MKTILQFIVFVFVYAFYLSAQHQPKANNNNSYTTHYQTISVNQLKMIISNDGMGSYNPETGSAGLFWPGGKIADKPLASNDGLYWVGKIGDSVFAGASAYSTSYQPGKIVSTGLADDPGLQNYRVYKINKNWESYLSGQEKEKLKKDFLDWPAEDGAPFYDSNNNGRFDKGIDEPLFYGDEQLWFVANDLYAAQTTYTTGTLPVGIEMQLLIYAFKNSGVLGNTIFKVYRLINKSEKILDSLFIGYFSHAILGDSEDNYAGCDEMLNLGYFYNSDAVDTIYGNRPPALGYQLLQGPMVPALPTDSAKKSECWVYGFKNLKMTSFIVSFPVTTSHLGSGWNNNPLHPSAEGITYSNALGLFYISKGQIFPGVSFIDPTNGNPTKYFLSGDPVTGSGWIEHEGPPYYYTRKSRAFYLNSGPINFAPGDTQEVAIAIHVAQGNDNIDAVDRLKRNAKNIQYFYDHYAPEKTNNNYKPGLPDLYKLEQNFPNPFNPVTTIKYSLPIKGLVALKVYDVLGNEIKVLVNEEQEAGEYQTEFKTNGLSSGVYFYSITSNEFSRTKKMMIIK